VAVGLGVLAYFAVFTIWLPSRLLQFNSLASADQLVQDLAVTGSWAVPLLAAFLFLRWAQRRGLI